MALKSRRKGASGERDAVNLWKDAGFDAYRGSPLQAASATSLADVEVKAMPWLWVEVKRQKVCSLPAALKQATEAAPQGKMPMALCRSDGQGWTVTMHFKDFVKILGMVPNLSNQMELFREQSNQVQEDPDRVQVRPDVDAVEGSSGD